VQQRDNQQVRTPTPRGPRQSGSARRVTLALIVVLLALGALGAGSLWALNGTLVPPASSQDKLATRICAAYQARNYDALIADIDPTPVPPTAPTDFTPEAQKALITTLSALDTQSGAVIQCSFAQNSSTSGDHLHYTFTMKRAKGQQSTQVMDFVHEKDGSWKLARDSQFIPSAR
jgi:hypothetical protein